MQSSDTRALQTILKKQGLYTANIDGSRGPKTDKAIELSLQNKTDQLSSDWQAWSSKRKAVALLQIFCHEHEIDSGKIDGFYGPQTENAADSLRYFLKHGRLPISFSDIDPIRENPHSFPLERKSLLDQYYGEVCQIPKKRVRCPWELRLDWDLTSKTSYISIHEQLADSLESILNDAYDLYGESVLKEHGLDRYGGSYNCRKKRGSNSSWSTHAWAIAIDWYPSRNKLKWGTDKASLAHPDLKEWWELWEKEGWYNLGRFENRDWMHVQAAKR